MRNILVAIDVGSSITRVVAVEFLNGEKNPRIIGIGQSETVGMRNGYITKYSNVVESIKKALLITERSAGIKIKNVLVSLSGLSLKTEVSSGTTIISRSDNEVTSLDIEKALTNAEDNFKLVNKKILETHPISFKLDGKEVLGRLEGMRGNKLELKALLITYSTQHLEDLLSAIIEAGAEPIDTTVWPFACSSLLLSEKQKKIGVALVNIGAELVSMAVFENGSLISINSFPVGASSITHDIALGFKISHNEAENFKLGNITNEYPKKKLEEIIEARLYDILELIENHLKRIKRDGLLPAGVIFVGGGANTQGLERLSKTVLKLPSKIGFITTFGQPNTKFYNPEWATILGILEYSKMENINSVTPLKNKWKNIKNIIKEGLKQLMP